MTSSNTRTTDSLSAAIAADLQAGGWTHTPPKAPPPGVTAAAFTHRELGGWVFRGDGLTADATDDTPHAVILALALT